MRKPFKIKGRTGYFLKVKNPQGKLSRIKIGESKADADKFFKNYIKNENAAVFHEYYFDYVAKQWLARAIITEVKSGNISREYLLRASDTCDRFSKAHNDPMLTEITPLLLDNWHIDKSPSYRRTEYAIIKRVLKWAKKYGFIQSNPIEEVRLPGERNKEVTLLSEQDYLAILELVSAEAKTILSVLWHTGARPSELTDLQWDSVAADLTYATLKKHKNAKRHKCRTIYFNLPSREILQRCQNESRTGHVFLNTKGRPWNRDALGAVLDRVWTPIPEPKNPKHSAYRDEPKQLGPKTTLYAFRHTYITRALVAQIPIAEVAELTGTSVEMIEKTYGHFSQVKDHLVKAADRLI